MFNFFFETFRLGIKNLRLHKLRSLLTALGIIFGVAAVIIMVAIGEGSKREAMKQVEQLGACNILIRSVRPPESQQASQRTSRVLDYGIKRADLGRMKMLPHLKTIVPLRDTEQKVVRGDVKALANAVGTVPEAITVINLQLEQGRFINQVDYDNLATVCVLGHIVARQLFPYQNPLGEQVLVGTSGRGSVLCTVVGVLEPTGLRVGSEGAAMVQLDPDKTLYFPLSVAQSAFGDTNATFTAGSQERKQIELTEIWLQADQVENVERLASIAQNTMKIGHGERVDFEVKAPIQILRAAERQARMFNFILGGIASFALVVGGIGIMNIMLASVTERTREIGIRRALGAKRRHITLQFLIETTVISLTGGLIGIVGGWSIAQLLPRAVRFFSHQHYPTAVTSWSVIGSFLVSILIGVGFGLYPAITAARMNPIDALRHE